MILPDTDISGGFAACEKVRERVAEADFTHETGTLNLNLTMGVAAYTDGFTAQDLLRHADEALYRGKVDGKNHVVASRPATSG